MADRVYYYHLGNQCYGTGFMGEKARELAQLLRGEYTSIDIEQVPWETKKLKLFFPGTIIVNDFRTVFPGTAEELLASYENRGPLKGVYRYKELPQGEGDEIGILNDYLGRGAAICLGDWVGCEHGLTAKEKWLEKHSPYTGGISGFLVFKNRVPVAAVEFIQEARCAYPLPRKREDALFITCIYGGRGIDFDYRASLIAKMKEFARQEGCKTISVIAGLETPYPNGPESFFTRLGFLSKELLGQVLLRYRWDEIRFLEIPVVGDD